jgi:FtsP/CotA-like multicopper oxidase with cupredoxin domain
MQRREFLELSFAWAASVGTAFGQHGHAPSGGRATAPTSQVTGPADLQLRIGPVSWELAPRRSVRTLGYNGQVPGPLVRARAGRPFTVDVVNETSDEDIVHWHGFHIPPDVDGSVEEGTPPVAPGGGRQRYTFTPDPAGTRWYHSHAVAGRNLKKSTYSGQFGMFIVESGDEPGAYDIEVPILLHEWEPRFNEMGDIEFRYFSINGKMLGASDPIRVRESQRVLFRIVNASATLQHRLALPGHAFEVIALDGNPVPAPKKVQVLDLGPGERVDALVDMNRPGVWTLGALRSDWRQAGMGIVVEYAGRQGPAQWSDPGAALWDYGVFGDQGIAPEPDGRLTLVFRAVGDGHRWTINDKSYPRTSPILVKANRRYRWLLDNQSAENHPVHLHRHTFEVVGVDGRPMSGIRKDVVVVPAWKQAEIDVVADHPGLSLFHCHQQFHMDMGFMAMLQYE